MEEKKVEACADRLFNEMNAGMSCLNLHVDHRLGLFQALADAGSATFRDISHLSLIHISEPTRPY